MMDKASSPQVVMNGANVLKEADCGVSVDLPADDHLTTLKALTEKLRLETRRPSYLEWKARVEAESFRESHTGKRREEWEGAPVTSKDSTANADTIHQKQTSSVLKGFENIDEALLWLRQELTDMRLQDQHEDEH